MSIVPILNMLGSVAAYPMGEWLGRKKVWMQERYLDWNKKVPTVILNVLIRRHQSFCMISVISQMKFLQVLILSTILNIMGFVIIYFR